MPGTAVLFTGDPTAAPTALMHNLKGNRILHERNIILSIKTEEVPRVPRYERVTVDRVTDSFIRVVARYGFMETPSVPKILDVCRRKDLNIDIGATSFFLSRRNLKPTPKSEMPGWQVGPEPDLSIVTCRYLPRRGDANEFNRSLVQAVVADGSVVISATEIEGAYTLRLAILHYRSHLAEVDRLLEVLSREAARLLLLVALVDLRDVAWAEMSRADADRHVDLWRDLLRRCPRDLVPAAASLLAFAAWLDGHGALAWCALDRCLDVDPEYSMAACIGPLLEAAVPPSVWTPLSEADLPVFSRGERRAS